MRVFHQEKLTILSILNVLERSGYYGLQSFFVFYFLQKENIDEISIYTLFGIFYGLIFLFTPLSAYIIQKARDPILLYKICFCLMPVGIISFTSTYFWIQSIGMSIIIFTTSFFRIIVPILVGEYSDLHTEEKRNLFFRKIYTHANIGSFLTPIITGALSIHFTWTASIIFIGILYVLGAYIICRYGTLIYTSKRAIVKKMKITHSFFLIILCCLIPLLLLKHNELYTYFYISVLGGLIIFLSFYTIKTNTQEKKNLSVIHIMLVLLLFFMGFYEQHGSSINIFVFEHFDRHVFDHEIPLNFFQSIAPLVVVILGPILSSILLSPPLRHVNKNIFVKIALSFLILAIAYMCFYKMAQIALIENSGPIFLLILGLIFLAIAEILFLPILSAVITKFSPPRLKGLYLSLQNITISSGVFLATILSKLTNKAFNNGHDKIDSYDIIYCTIALTCFVLMILSFFIARRMHQKNYLEKT